MSFWTRFFKTEAKPAARAITGDTIARGSGLLDAPARTGVHVTEDTALAVSAVWCAVNVISSSIASLPLTLYKRLPGDTQEEAREHPIAALLDIEPNPESTARVFWESFVANALLHGQGLAEVERDGSGRPVRLWPIHPSNVQLDRDTLGRLVYRVQVGAVTADLRSEDVLHVPGLSPDTLWGHSVLRVARDNIGFSIAADAYGQHYFSKAGNVGTYLSYPGTLSDTARENIRRSFQKQAGGIENTGRAYLLEEGMTAKRESLSNEAAQYDETRRYQITEVARLFNVSPTKLHELGRATWGNLGALNSDFWGTTCRPWAVKIEAEIARKLLMPGERSLYYAEFDADTLLRGDISTRYAAYEVGIRAGFLSPETVARWESLPTPQEPEPESEPQDPQPQDPQETDGPENL